MLWHRGFLNGILAKHGVSVRVSLRLRYSLFLPSYLGGIQMLRSRSRMIVIIRQLVLAA